MQNAVMCATMTRIEFTEAAAQAIVDDQGIDSLNEIRLLTDKEIESLCKVLPPTTRRDDRGYWCRCGSGTEPRCPDEPT